MKLRINAFFIFLIAKILFFLTGVFKKSPEACLLGDSWILHKMAVNYIDTGLMSYLDSTVTLFQLPFYPWLISIFYRIFGEDPRYILAFQIVMSSVLFSVIYKTFKHTVPTHSWVFLLFLILDIHILLYSSCLLTEFWVCFFWNLAWVCLYYFKKTDSRLYLVLWSVLLGFAAWTKPFTVFLFPFMFVCLLIVSPWIRSKWKVFILTPLIYFLILAPLFFRNYQHTGEIGRYSTISSFNAWYFNIAYHESKIFNKSLQEVRTEKVNEMREFIELNSGRKIDRIPESIANDRQAHVKALGVNEFEYSRYADKLASAYMKENFFSYAFNHLISGINIFTVSNLSWLKNFYYSFEAISFSQLSFDQIKNLFVNPTKQLLLLIFRFYELAFILMCGIGFLLLLIFSLKELRLKLEIQYAILMIVYVTCISGVNVWGRFRYLFMPMFIYLGVLGYTHLKKKLKDKSNFVV